MDIKDVKLTYSPAVEAGTDENGLVVLAQPESYVFEVMREDDAHSVVPNDPANAHYWEVKAWYDAQETKPFDFTFEQMPEPNFAETVYPEEAEAPEETETTLPDEPKTLLPK